MQSASLDFLTSLIAAASPSGFERPTARLFRDHVTPLADRVDTDIVGNVVAVLNPDARMKVMLTAHLDEIGFIIHHIGDDGLLYFSPIGGHDCATLLGQRIWVHGAQRVPGVIGRKAAHLLDPDESARKPRMTDMWIDIGATSRDQAGEFVRLGDAATFQHEFQALMGSRATARAFDNKAGLCVIAETLRMLRQDGGLDPGVGVYAVASVQEEIGSRGAQIAAHAVSAQTGLAVDMGQATDYPDADARQHGVLTIGKGPGVDRGANTSQKVFDILSRAALDEGIPHQVHVTPGATPTDAKVMQINRDGMATGLLSVPLRYMQSPCEVLDLEDLDRTARLAAAYCRRIRPDTDFCPY